VIQLGVTNINFLLVISIFGVKTISILFVAYHT